MGQLRPGESPRYQHGRVSKVGSGGYSCRNASVFLGSATAALLPPAVSAHQPPHTQRFCGTTTAGPQAGLPTKPTFQIISDCAPSGFRPGTLGMPHFTAISDMECRRTTSREPRRTGAWSAGACWVPDAWPCIRSPQCTSRPSGPCTETLMCPRGRSHLHRPTSAVSALRGARLN